MLSFSRSAVSVGSAAPWGVKNHQYSVGIGILSNNLQRFLEAFAIGIPQNIDGVLVAPFRRQKPVQASHSGIAEGRQLPTCGNQRIGGKYPQPP